MPAWQLTNQREPPTHPSTRYISKRRAFNKSDDSLPGLQVKVDIATTLGDWHQPMQMGTFIPSKKIN